MEVIFLRGAEDGKARHDMKEEPANRDLRVAAIGQGLKMDMLVFHLINQI